MCIIVSEWHEFSLPRKVLYITSHHRRWEFFESRRSIYQTLHSIFTHGEHRSCPTLCFPTFKEFGEKYLPSGDIIRKCFLAKFLEEIAYINDIQSVCPGETLSFDHTFKIASNIGCIRLDKKWTCQYDSAFLVFNGNGKIVSWQFTKENGFDHVRNLLHNVKKRNQEMNSEVKTIFVASGDIKSRRSLVQM